MEQKDAVAWKRVKWVQNSTAIRVSLGVSADFRPWQAEAELYGLPASIRMIEGVELYWIQACKELEAEYGVDFRHLATSPSWRGTIAKGLGLDVSQGIQRKTKTQGPRIRTLTQKAAVYLFDGDMVLDGEDKLACQGLAPEHVTDFVDNTEAGSLAGEAWFWGHTTMFLAAWYSIPTLSIWRPKSELVLARADPPSAEVQTSFARASVHCEGRAVKRPRSASPDRSRGSWSDDDIW